MAELLEAVASWKSLLSVLLVFGFAPGFLMRLLVRIYPKDDPQRANLMAELYSRGRLERPLFVAENLETALAEGVPHRIRALLRRKPVVSGPVGQSAPDRSEFMHEQEIREPFFYGGVTCLGCKSAPPN
ncbi:hypothetical protein [Saccharopolyspora sp. NPDC002376]